MRLIHLASRSFIMIVAAFNLSIAGCQLETPVRTVKTEHTTTQEEAAEPGSASPLRPLPSFPPAELAVEVKSASITTYLIWGRSAGKVVNYEVVASPTGTVVVAKGKGVSVAVEGKRVAIKRFVRSTPRYTCEPADRLDDPALKFLEKSRRDRIVQKGAVKSRRYKMIQESTNRVSRLRLKPIAEFDHAGFKEVEDGRRPIASVGPYLAIAGQHLAAYPCAVRAPEIFGWSISWFDLRDGKRFSLADEVTVPAKIIARAAKRMHREWNRDVTFSGASPQALEQVAALMAEYGPLVARDSVKPRLADGRWRASYYLTVGVNGFWMSSGTNYQRDIFLPGASLGERFRVHDVLPPLVLAFLAENPRFKLGGFSILAGPL